jgi:hypothetical protein
LAPAPIWNKHEKIYFYPSTQYTLHCTLDSIIDSDSECILHLYVRAVCLKSLQMNVPFLLLYIEAVYGKIYLNTVLSLLSQNVWLPKKLFLLIAFWRYIYIIFQR